MSLSDLASLGSFVSGAAVLVSLIFLYFQLRQLNEQVKQADRNQQAQLRQTRADRSVSLVLARLDPSVASAFYKAFLADDDMSLVELEQFNALQRATFFSWQETFDQHRAGFVDEAEFAEFTKHVRALCASHGVRFVWRLQQRFPLGPDFTRWIEEQMAAQQPSPNPPDRASEWKKYVATVKSGAPA